MRSSWTFTQKCGGIAVLCAAWNLLGDLYFMDFYTFHLSAEKFGMIRRDVQPGYLFDLQGSFFWAFVAQSGGWMYPIWAFVTAVPIYIGLQEEDEATGGLREQHFWKSMAPCLLLAYGLCVVGGGLHSAFAFLTVLPATFHDPLAMEKLSTFVGYDQFSTFLESAQSRIIQHIVVGCIPGIIACNVASLWIAVLVHFRPTRFPKSYNFFNPLVTSFWVQIAGALLPEQLGFYFVGCLGTWGVLVLSLATTFMLKNIEETKVSYHEIS